MKDIFLNLQENKQNSHEYYQTFKPFGCHYHFIINVFLQAGGGTGRGSRQAFINRLVRRIERRRTVRGNPVQSFSAGGGCRMDKGIPS